MKYLALFLFAALLVAFFVWGIEQNSSAVRADCEKEVVIQEKEVVKYVYKSDSKIYAKPNSDTNGIAEWLRGNKKR